MRVPMCTEDPSVIAACSVLESCVLLRLPMLAHHANGLFRSLISSVVSAKPVMCMALTHFLRHPWQDYAYQHMRFSNCVNLTVVGPTVVYNSLRRLPFTQATLVGMSGDSRNWTVQVLCLSHDSRV